MIAGFSGHLLPEDFVEPIVDDPRRAADAAALQRDIARWLGTTTRLGPASGLRAVVDVAAVPLATVLGLVPDADARLAGTHAVLPCRAGSSCVPLLVVPWGTPLTACWRDAVVEAAALRAAWCVIFNGTHVRLVSARRLQSRRHAEIALDAAADDRRTAAALALLFDATALADDDGTGGPLARLVIEGDRHAAGVCRSLRRGVLDASTHVLRALFTREAARPVADVFEQSLTIVYRLLFLLFAEARGLVPLWHPIYRRSYSIEALREAALASKTTGLWDTLRAVTRLAHAGCRAGSLSVTPFNGRLFSPLRTPLAERRGLDDDAARSAIVALSTRQAPDRESRQRIQYRDLGVEQLGAVYETLLDYAPRVERSARGRPLRVSLEPGSGVRKATGTFYTPQPLVDYLVRDTLGPIVRERTPEEILAVRVLDPSMGSGAFLVGACRYVAAAYEAALVAHGRCHAADIRVEERATIRRTVAERCLFGVDINPTAVQLARLSLWLTTLAGDRPLSFLDHHLRVGDSLAGTWLSRLRQAPARRPRSGTLPLFADAAPAAAIREALPVRFRLAEDPNDTPAHVRDKERALARLSRPDSPLTRWRRVADAWCAAWLAVPAVEPAAFTALRDAILTGRSALPEPTWHELLGRVTATAAARAFFHWELEFPEVFFDDTGTRRPDGGFDVVIGNPPWDMIRADAGTERTRARAEASAFVRFARDSGAYDVRADGQVNRYQLFVDRAVALTRPGGRIGLVLPSGVLADAGSAALRRMLFTQCSVDRLVGFDNRHGTFPVHRSVKFVLMSATAGARTGEIRCRFGESDPASLDRAVASDGQADPAWFTTRITPTLVEQLSGDDMSVPDFRSAVDIAIAERAAALFAPLGARSGWNVHFGRELNATEDRMHFRASPDGVPVFEGKMIQPFRILRPAVRWHVSEAAAERLLGPRWRRPRLAYRDVASPTNMLTLIAAVLPARTVSTHTLFCLKRPLPARSQQLLCALFNSLVVNYLVRLRVSTHVTTATVERLPVPREDEAGSAADLLVDAGQTLACGPNPEAFARLNVAVARLYRLEEAEFAHVLDTFPLIDAGERTVMRRMFRAGR